jgi:site-specific DNA-methyltransferase (adenine-specific)
MATPQRRLSETVRRLGRDPLDAYRHSSGPGWTLAEGDCRDLLPMLPPASVDLVFADPPYFLSNGGYTCQAGRRAPVRKGAWDASRGLAEDHRFNVAWLAACQRVLKPEGTLWVSGTQHVIFSVGFALQSLGWKLLNTVTWYKPNASPNLSCRYFTHSSELLIWAAPHPGPRLQHTFHYSEMREEAGGKQMRDVWALPRPGDEELRDDGEGRVWTMTGPRRGEKTLGRHPTQKPLALLDRIVRASSSEGALVLDPFCGSGTTGVAAVELGRRFLGLDLSPDYLRLAEGRLLGLSPRSA